MEALLYKMQCITNQHVGNGDTGYSVIGNEVEKDPVLQTPIINGSGVKGSMREYCRKEKLLEEWFGTGIGKVTEEKQSSQPGNLRFLSAQLLARPIRVSAGSAAYALASTITMLKYFCQLCEKFKITYDGKLNIADLNGLATDKSWRSSDRVQAVEGYEIVDKIPAKLKPFLQTWFHNEEVVILPDGMMQEIELPIIARNKLENGSSANLWYEEIVPHESVFYTIIFTDESKIIAGFNKVVDGRVIQMGGNASIGYGYMAIECMNPKSLMQGD